MIRRRRSVVRLCSFLLLILLFALFAAAAENGQTFDGPGGKIYYEVIGTGTTLILINGGPGFDHSYLHITPAWDALAKTHRVIFYDQRGNGRSSPLKPGQSCTLADQIEDLDALRAHLGLEKADLLGHSWGGYLAMAYGARHPERISHLILVDSAAPKWSDTLDLTEDVFPEAAEHRAAAAFASEMGDRTALAASLRGYFSMLFYSPEKRDAWLAQMSPDAYHDDVYKAVTSDLSRFDLNPEIRKFRFPVMVANGRHDMNVAPVVAYRIHQAIAGSRFVVFEYSGHLPFYEEPEGFVHAVEEFLTKSGTN